jgi:hypothetical protein
MHCPTCDCESLHDLPLHFWAELGRRLGRLVVTDDGEWAIEVLEVAGVDSARVESGELAEEPAA